jgi:hypothetical protein
MRLSPKMSLRRSADGHKIGTITARFQEETAMFEQELEMEKKESSVLPLLLIVAFIVTIVGFAGYYVVQNHKVLSSEEATRIATTALADQGPAVLTFHTGLVKSSVDDNGAAPHYKLLEKAGLVKLGKAQGTYGTIIPIELTAKGTDFLKQVPGVSQAKQSDGTQLYTVPLAERKLLAVSEVRMHDPAHALVNITWAWQTTAMGELFDAAGPTVKAFNTWDRATLIQKHGAAFYHEAPTKATLALSKGDKGWGIATE